MRKYLFSISLLLVLIVVSCENGVSGDSSSDAASPAPAVATYAVTYDGNGATGGSVPVDGVAYEEGKSVTVKADTGSLTKTGYVFCDWNSAADGSGTTYAPGSTIAMGSSNLKLYAKWGSGWDTVGSAGFSAGDADYLKLAFDPKGVPYVAYRDSANNYYASVMKFDGSAWVQVGTAGFSDREAGYLSFALDPSGVPYVAYNRGGAGVMKYTGSSWVQVGPQYITQENAYCLSLAIDPSGVPYIAYRDESVIPPTGPISVMKYVSSSSSWVQVGAKGFNGENVEYVSIAFDPSGVPYVAYMDNDVVGASVMKFDGSSWVQVGAERISAFTVRDLSLAFDPSGVPYVAYGDGLDSYKANVMKFDGSSWVQVGSAGFSPGSAYSISIAISQSGTPYVAYTDYSGNGNKASAMKFDGSSWVQLGVAGFSPSRVDSTTLALSPSSVPYVAFRNSDYKATVMRYTR